ncbi:hypothetical protein MKK88_00300 [Methylobacterium sp. E-005]|uniref:hypothetical protein n=1 Tax=Methylobacterium sp. E-005 TaxID=2836549 RepID=UPI001FBA443D|nr:hypothetical protein [Methylobacterium sp. E-005]MCJ2084436.1 hypothetical protein [Methylobacterium sp. E-005]
MEFADTFVFERDGQTARIAVPAARKLIFLFSDRAPVPGPDLEAGTYEVSADSIRDKATPFPLAVLSVKRKHVPMWLALSAARAAEILKDAADGARAVRLTGGRMQ